MGRVSPSYVYSCNPSAYSAGNYSACERGDLSGKFGAVIPDSNGFVQSPGVLVDNLPYFNSNYLTAEQTSTMWASIVFHCASNGDRVLCAKFSPQSADLQHCSTGFNSINTYIKNNDPQDVDDKFVHSQGIDDDNKVIGHTVAQFDSAIYTTFFVSLIISFLVGVAIHKRFFTAKAPMSSSGTKEIGL
jgi:hypothetical protein